MRVIHPDPVRCASNAPTRLWPTSEVRGDLDGDGTADQALLLAEVRSRALCGFRLRIDTGEKSLILWLPGGYTGFATTGLPSLEGLVDISSRPGLELVIRVSQGAATSSAAVFAVRAGKIVRLALPDGRLFRYFGSATHLTGVDCIRGPGRALVAQTVAGTIDAEGRRWSAAREIYELRGVRFLRRPRVENTITGGDSQLGQTFPELTHGPFRSCMRAIARPLPNGRLLRAVDAPPEP